VQAGIAHQPFFSEIHQFSIDRFPYQPPCAPLTPILAGNHE
jgi:hypothetical protein